MLECLMQRIKSSATYDHLRSRNLLSLPHPNTLRKILSGMSNEFGFNKYPLEAIERTLRGKTDAQRLGVLCLDEIMIKEDMSFNTASFRFEGFVDLGDDGNVAKEQNMVYHGLFLIFRPLLDCWVQPIAVYASASAASAESLHRLLLKALVLLEAHGAQLLSVFVRWVYKQQKLWKLLGVKADECGVRSHIMHPTVPDAKLYFMLDPPHAFKCIRNHIFLHNVVQASGLIISHDQIVRFFNEDQRMGHLKLCPRLTFSQIYQTSFQKMSVKLAVKVFSNSLADGFDFFRNHCDEATNEKFRYTDHIEELIRLLNMPFDILNARRKFAPAMNAENWPKNKEVLLISKAYQLIAQFFY